MSIAALLLYSIRGNGLVLLWESVDSFPGLPQLVIDLGLRQPILLDWEISKLV